MAYQQSDLDQIDAAVIQIASSGVAEVQFADGRKVKYVDPTVLTRVREVVAAQVAAQARAAKGAVRRKFASYRSGF